MSAGREVQAGRIDVRLWRLWQHVAEEGLGLEDANGVEEILLMARG